MEATREFIDELMDLKEAVLQLRTYESVALAWKRALDGDTEHERLRAEVDNILGLSNDA